MRLEYTTRTRDDISAIYDHIALYSGASAQRVEDAIRARCESLKLWPFSGTATRRGVRRLPMVRLPYTIFYAIDESGPRTVHRIVIVRVVHSARVRDLDEVPDEP